MEKFSINWKILIGQIINFLVLFFLAKKFVFPRFFALLKEKQETIEREKKAMEELEEKRRAIEREKERVLNEARERADSILKEAKEKAREKAKTILEMAQKEREKIITETKRIGKEEIERMKKEFWKKNLEIVLSLTEKFLAKKIDAKEDKRIILKLLKELEKDGKGI